MFGGLGIFLKTILALSPLLIWPWGQVQLSASCRPESYKVDPGERVEAMDGDL